MIYDCFAFFNELDLLEIRLNELDSVVDRFVLVEATRTFQKKEKPLHFTNNKARFARFLPKICCIVVDEYPNFFSKFRIPRAWDYDDHQKEQILQGLKDCKDDDVIIVSDLDEIPRADLVKQWAHTPGIKIFQQRLFYYYLNCFIRKYPEPLPIENGIMYWHGSVMLSYQNLRQQQKTIQKTRLNRGQRTNTEQIHLLPEGGWHFSYLGGVQKVIEKLEAYAHQEHNRDEFKDPEKIRQIISQGGSLYGQELESQILPIDSQFPLYVQQNQEKFQSLILASPTESIITQL